jgi:hypothetical protein
LGDAGDLFQEVFLLALGSFIEGGKEDFFLSIGDDTGDTGHEVEVDAVFLVC